MQSPLGFVFWVLLAHIVACQELGHTAPTHHYPRVKFQETCWLFGVLRHGPNNQKEDLRNLLLIAKEINCGIIITGFYKHCLDQNILHPDTPKPSSTRLNKGVPPIQTIHTTNAQPRQCFASRIPHYMNFTDVLSREPIDKYVPTATPEELYAQGWNGELDAVLHPEGVDLDTWKTNSHIHRSLAAAGARVPIDRVTEITMPSPMHCQTSHIMKLKAQARDHRVIGVLEVLMGHNIKFSLNNEHLQLPSEGCERSLHEAARLLQPAEWIRKLAADYVAKHITNGPKQSFLAAHVRPYPDACLHNWQNYTFRPMVKLPGCHNSHSYLHDKVGPCAAKLIARTTSKVLFVMTHPSLVPVVDQLLQGNNVNTATYLNMTAIMEMSGCVDNTNTFSVLIEQAIAARAARFLGTSLSSITHTVVLQRLGAGIDNHLLMESEYCDW